MGTVRTADIAETSDFNKFLNATEKSKKLNAEMGAL